MKIEKSFLSELIKESERLIGINELDEARKLLMEILQKYDTKNIDAANNYAVTEIMLGNYESAEDLLKQILEKDTENEVAIENLRHLIGLNENKIKNIIKITHQDKDVSFYLPYPDDHVQKEIIKYKRFYENEMLQDIQNRITPDSIIVDVGANIGNHTLFFGLFCSPKKVYSFEPNEITYKILRKNVKINKLENKIESQQVAIGDVYGKAEVIIGEQNNLGMAQIHRRPDGNISICTLDKLIDKNERISLIKIDVEGFELKVLQGAKRILQKDRPLLYIECAEQNEFKEILSFLSNYGYKAQKQFNYTPTYLFESFQINTHTDKLKISFFAGDGDNFTFARPIISYLESHNFDVDIFSSKVLTNGEIKNILMNSDLAWFEWGNGPIIHVSKLEKFCPIICRIHKYEVYTNIIKNINFKNIDKIIFVSEKIKNRFLLNFSEYSFNANQLNVLPNSIQLPKYFQYHNKGFEIAWIGRIHYVKNLPLAIEILVKLIQIDKRYRLHIAGEKKDLDLYDWLIDIKQKLNLDHNLILHGFVNDIDKWLNDKNYLLSTAVIESQGLGIMEAMANGIKPVIYNGYALDTIYDKKFLFKTTEEAIRMITEKDYNSNIYRDFIEQNFDEKVILPQVKDLILKTTGFYSVKPFVSICIPTYNRSNLIGAAIESALAQTYTNFEIVIVDDGSNDNTESIVKGFKSEKIKYHKQEHFGGPSARNKAIQISSGEFILWLGDDDELNKNILEIYVNTLKHFPDVDIFYSYYKVFKVLEKSSFIREYPDWYNEHSNLLGELIFTAQFMDGGGFFRREVLEKVGPYNAQFPRAHDYEYAARIALDPTIKLKLVPEPLYTYYRYNNNTLTGEWTNKDLRLDSVIIDFILNENKITDLFPSLITNEMIAKKCFEIAERFSSLKEQYKTLEYLVKSYEYDKNDVVLERINKQKNKIFEMNDQTKSFCIHDPSGKIKPGYDYRKIILPYLTRSKLSSINNSGNELPLFSIIMANYNGEKYIGEAINSVLNQTFKHWELIIIDDASTDNSIEIINRFLNDDRIKFIQHKTNKKYIGALKTGINNVNSNFFGLLDSDDALTNDAIETMYYAHVQNSDAGYIYSQFIYCDEKLKQQNIGYCKAIDNGKSILDSDVASHFKTFKLKDYLKTDGYDFAILHAEDKDISYKMEEVSKLLFIDKPLYLYRVLDGSISHITKNRNQSLQTMQDAKINAIKRRRQISIELNSLSISHFELAQKYLTKSNFSSAIDEISKYQKNINYDVFPYHKNYKIENPDLSVIIVSYQTKKDLIKCINSVLNNKERNFEIIVVDNGGNDEVLADLLSLPIKYVRSPINLILSEGRNIGVNFAKGNIVAFLDDDAIVPHDYTSSILNAFQKYDIHGFRGKVLPKSTSKNNNSAHHYDLGETPFPHVCDTEGNSAFKKESYLAVSGMDPLLFGGEGLDLSFRLFQKYDNYSVIYWPETIIYHDYASSDDKLKKKVKRHEVMNSYLFQKYGEEFEKWYHNILNFKNDHLSVELGNSLIDKKMTDPLEFQPLISICIPTYNRVNFLKRSLKIALLQTYSNFEVVIIDDGSTDGTEKYIKSINNSRLKYFRKKHEGAPAARNLAIEKSEGDYILWLDSDDEIRNLILQEYVKILNAQKEVDIVYCNLVRREEKEIPYFNYFKSYNGIISPSDLLFGSPIPNIGCLVKKQLYQKIGNYNLSFKRAQDYEFWSRAVKTAKVRHCPKFLATQHKHNFGHLSPTDVKTVDFTYEIKILNNILADYEIEEIFNEVNWKDLSEESKKEYYSDAYITIAKAFHKWDQLDKVYDFTSKAYELTPTENIKKILASFKNLNVDQNNIEKTAILHIKDVLTKAKKLMDDKKLNEALVMIENTIQLYDQNIDVLKSKNFASIINLAGNICLENEDLDLAMQYFELELNNFPTASKACAGLGEVLLRQENYESSKTMFEWAVINDEENFSANQFLIEINKILGFSETHNTLIENEKLNKNNIMEGNNILISILIPTYNRAKFLSKTIESALDQDYSNYEIIILDDGSTDNTESVIKPYLQNEKIKYYKKEHTNAPDTRNKLIDLAMGDYILWLDSDDNLYPNVLSKYVDTLNNYPAVNMVYGNLHFVDFDGNEKGNSNYVDWYNKRNELKSKIISGQPFPNPFMLIKKSLYNEVGTYNIEFTRAHDYEFNSRLVTEANINMKLIDETIGNYIIHDQNLTTTNSGKIDTTFEIKILDSLLKYPLHEYFPDLDWVNEKKESTANALAKIASQYHKYGSYEKSVQYYQKSLETYPYNSYTYYGLGEIAFEMNKLVEAKNLFNQAANYSSTLDYAKDRICIINEKLGLKEDENDVYSLSGKRTLIEKAENAIHEGDLKLAENYLNNILEVNPIFIEALNNFAVIHIMENNAEEALKRISKIIEIDPQNITALENLKYLEENLAVS